MRNLVLLVTLGLSGVLAQDALPAMPAVEEGSMLPMEPGLVVAPIQIEEVPDEEEAAEDEATQEEAVYEASVEVPSPEESGEESEEKVLVRCKRPLCKMLCPYGYRTGADGCASCACLENPCAVVDCMPGKICKPKKCEEESCTVLEAECIDLPIDCPLRKCAHNCNSGYVKDAHGCRTCECLEDEPFEMLPPEFGLDLDAPCPMPMCAEPCEFGMKLSERGCMTCECNTEPVKYGCDAMTCDEGLECLLKKPADCPTCRPKPMCTVPSLCNSIKHMREGFKLGGDMPEGMDPFHRPICRNDGTFAPTQCHQTIRECWCVDDRGHEVEGTRVAGSIECSENKTAALHIDFTLVHEFGEDELTIMIQSQDIHIVIQEHLGKWLSMDKDNVLIVSVIPEGDTIIVKTILVSDGMTDLPSAANHLGNRMHEGKCNINYRGKTLKPKPDSVNVHHQYRAPQLPGSGGVHEFTSFCRKHRTAMIAGSVGLIFFVIMMITLIVYVCKRKRCATAQFAHRRLENMENFKKNLIHSRDWEQPELVVADKDKNVQLISQEQIA